MVNIFSHPHEDGTNTTIVCIQDQVKVQRGRFVRLLRKCGHPEWTWAPLPSDPEYHQVLLLEHKCPCQDCGGTHES
jgi:hypothetical protein